MLSHLQRSAGLGVAAACLGCGPSGSSMAEGGASSATMETLGTTSETSTSPSESTWSTVDASSSTLATSEATETGNQDGCAPPNPDVFASSAGALTDNWPDGGTLDATCDAVEFVDHRTLRLTCMHPETGLPAEVVVSFSAGAVGSQLDDLPGTTGLLVSFFNPPRGSIGCIGCNDLRIHDSDGRLIALSSATWLFDSIPAEGTAIDLSAAKWLDPGSDAYENWSAPFGEMQMRHVGCAPRASLRPGSETETPLALEFMADNGLVAVYDRNIEYGVEVDGQRFDVLVSDAFFRGDLNCGDCPFTEGSYLVLRSGP